jgi:adenine-specific DNA-methyltransferase
MSKPKRKTERVARTSADLAQDQLAKLREIFPECFADGRVDFDKLRVTLGEEVDSRPERYSFTWAGKRDAIRLLQTPSRATLTPCPKDSVNFEETGNLFIEGDNLEVLKLLYKSYFGRVKMIYIDPPYNTGNDFIYPDNFADPLDTYLRLTGQKDNGGNLLTSNPETSGRYHSAWLSMMYPRLFLARQFLSDDGVMFVSVDDHEVHNLRCLMNEVFGEENRIESFIWKKSYGGGAKEKYAVTQHEYILLYARNLSSVADLWLPPDPDAEARYYKYRDDNFEKRGPYRLKPLEATKSMDPRPNLIYPIPLPNGGEALPKRQWWWKRERTILALERGELVFEGKGKTASVSYKQYLRSENGETRGAKPFSIIDGIYTQQGTADLVEVFGQPVIQFPKPVGLLKKLVSMATEPNQEHLVMDFFAGSCATAQAVLEMNNADTGDRRFLTIQLPETTPEDSIARKAGFRTIAEIGKERMHRVIRRLEQQREGRLNLKMNDIREDLGFKVFKLAESNYKAWTGVEEKDSEAYGKTMKLYSDPLVPGWKPDHVVWEVTIKEGFGLNSQIEKLSEIKGNTVYQVSDPERGQSFRICLDDALRPATLQALDLNKDDLFICRDKALDDEAAANLALQCRLKTV